MFIGEYHHSLDEKGRVAIPKKFRDDLSHGAVITRGLDACLFLYTHEEWKQIASKLSSLPISRKDTRAFSRLMLAGAMDVTPDKQGRIVIPEYLRRYASVSKDVVVAGLYNRLELWDKAAWDSYRSGTEENSEEIAEQIGELGI